MAITKSPLIRYKILDACFRNRYKKYTIDDLLQKINQDLYEISGDESNSIKLRQLRDDIAFMRSTEGWSVEFGDEHEGKKKVYRYEDPDFSIVNSPLNEIELQELQSAIEVLAQFEGMPQFVGIPEIVAKLRTDIKGTTKERPIIGFDSNQDLKGIEFFSELYNAVQNKHTLKITYHDFKSEEPYTFTFYPYYLKQYNNRWFIFGYNAETQKVDCNLAIDRIVLIKQDRDAFINSTIDWQDYFSDMIGVSKPEDEPLWEVILHFDKLTGKYMENKSIHETQKHKWINDETLELKIKVVLNYELERLILSYADSVKVISPISLQLKIIDRLKKATVTYITASSTNL